MRCARRVPSTFLVALASSMCLAGTACLKRPFGGGGFFYASCQEGLLYFGKVLLKRSFGEASLLRRTTRATSTCIARRASSVCPSRRAFVASCRECLLCCSCPRRPSLFVLTGGLRMCPADRVSPICPAGRASFRYLVRVSQMRSFRRVPRMSSKGASIMRCASRASCTFLVGKASSMCLAGMASLQRLFGRASFPHLSRSASSLCLVGRAFLRRPFGRAFLLR